MRSQASRDSESVREAATDRSFEALYAEHFDFVWRSLRRLGVHASVVEDALQDTFLVLHRKLDSLRPDVSTKSFVFGIAMRVAHDYRRSARRKSAVALEPEQVPSGAVDPFERAANRELGHKLERFLDGLEPDKRAVFVLFELEQMTAPEVGEALGIPLNAAYSRLRTARDRLMAFLDAEQTHG